MLVEPRFEQLVGEEAGLWETVHATGDRDKDHAVFIGLVGQVVFANDFVREVREFDADVLWA